MTNGENQVIEWSFEKNILMKYTIKIKRALISVSDKSFVKKFIIRSSSKIQN